MRENSINQKAFADIVKAYHDATGDPGKRLETAITAALGTTEGYGEEIAALCETEDIMPPESLLALVREYSVKAKQKADALKFAEEVNASVEKATRILTEIKENIYAGAVPDAPQMVKAFKDAQKHLSAILKPRKTGELTPENLHDFGTSEGFPIAFWNNLHIPTPGATIIGAKTGQGKTSALVNIARELLNQGRRVCFISYEMNAQEIGLALTLKKNMQVQLILMQSQ
jgi:Mrp family chromosome partitioning ATPase